MNLKYKLQAVDPLKRKWKGKEQMKSELKQVLVVLDRWKDKREEREKDINGREIKGSTDYSDKLK